MSTQFDLNIEEVLENWEVYHAIREVISNALDEKLITDSQDIEIYPDQNGEGFHIRDFGRGIDISHFTQNENPEKIGGPSGIIGRFGVGMLDALATFHRNGITPVIKSPHGTFTIAMSPKEGFNDIETLHVLFDDQIQEMEGTDFYLIGVTEKQISDAKNLFLKFLDTEILEETKFGSVISPTGDESLNRVFINGVLVNEEADFLFSYNITSLTKEMRKAFNRERSHVGRSVYQKRVKSILCSSKSKTVLSQLANQIRIRSTGLQCEEIRWADIAQIGINYLAESDNMVIFVTEQESINNPDEIERMKVEGYQIIVTSDNDNKRINNTNATNFQDYVRSWNDSFEFDFIEANNLNDNERLIFQETDRILGFVGWSADERPSVRISNTLQNEIDSTSGSIVTLKAIGVYSPSFGIIIKRSELSSFSSYASVLLHEAAHASSGATDATRRFETELTEYLGRVANVAFDNILPEEEE